MYRKAHAYDQDDMIQLSSDGQITFEGGSQERDKAKNTHRGKAEGHNTRPGDNRKTSVLE